MLLLAIQHREAEQPDLLLEALLQLLVCSLSKLSASLENRSLALLGPSLVLKAGIHFSGMDLDF